MKSDFIMSIVVVPHKAPSGKGGGGHPVITGLSARAGSPGQVAIRLADAPD
jgi:hypothetical protein